MCLYILKFLGLPCVIFVFTCISRKIACMCFKHTVIQPVKNFIHIKLAFNFKIMYADFEIDVLPEAKR